MNKDLQQTYLVMVHFVINIYQHKLSSSFIFSKLVHKNPFMNIYCIGNMDKSGKLFHFYIETKGQFSAIKHHLVLCKLLNLKDGFVELVFVVLPLQRLHILNQLPNKQIHN